MKQLSIEEKARAYDEALKKARILVGYPTTQPFISDLQDLFPELAESEDERIINRIKKAVEEYWSDEPLDEILTWLKKQAEHANFRNKIQIGDKVTRNEDGVLVNLSQLKRVAKKDEKQGEQKPIDPDTIIQQRVDALADIVAEQKPADKVEPKFREGDWVVSDDKYVHDDYRVCKITKIVDGRYYIEGGGFLSESSLALYKYRLWTIQDAKDGDVLVDEDDRPFIFKGFLNSRNPQFSVTFIKWSYWSFRY